MRILLDLISHQSKRGISLEFGGLFSGVVYFRNQESEQFSILERMQLKRINLLISQRHSGQKDAERMNERVLGNVEFVQAAHESSVPVSPHFAKDAGRRPFA
jgi:hypothetical protein